ncbi:DNA polymerase I [Fimbriiglobus ruber]|uniref:DNA polymerase I n=1 Tax=Fimbriiglobus ruber TaxID=1908690 RepID=UPI000B4B437A|nr:DNA polymerase I [Fimbriiglobus ruber]
MDSDPLPPIGPATGASTLYVLDAHGLIFQMFHGIPAMSAADGRPTNAVFGVTRALMNLYDHGAEYLIAALDRKEPTFREDLYKEYKAHRPPPPPDLLVQEPLIHQVMEAMRIPFLSVAGFEADDVMATLASEGAARGYTVNLCTSDKDCRQLLSDRVKILNLRKGAELDAAGLKADWGVAPAQVVDFQALVGDSVDNVPGVSGWGPKTAAKWLEKYGTLENLIAHADEVGGPKLREALKTAIADGSLALSRKLVQLDPRVPLVFDWNGWKRRDWDGPRLLELFQEFGFRGFANKVRSTLAASGKKQNEAILAIAGLNGPVPPAPTDATVPTAVSTSDLSTPGPKAGKGPKGGRAPKVPRPGQPTLFDLINSGDGAESGGDASPISTGSNIPAEPVAGADFEFGANLPAADWIASYQLVDTPAAFDTFLKKLRDNERFTFDLETTALDPLRAEIVGIAVSWTAGEAYYLPLRGPDGSRVLDPQTTLGALKSIFEDPAVKKVNQNIKYERLVLRTHDITLAGVAGDPMVAHYLLHSGERTHNLDELARRYLGHENISITELIGKGKKQITMDQVPVERVCQYAGEDADVAVRLAALLEPELDHEGLRRLYDDLELPLIEVLAELEFNGVLLDLPVLNQLGRDMEIQLARTEGEVQQLAGRKFNLGSPKQLREILFDEMKLPVQKRTGTTNEPSTDQESLERLAALGHEIPKKIIEHRQVAKLKGTYVDALPVLVNPKTGRVHTSFNQTVAATGRLSSSDPNLQNIPARTEQGRQIRQAFIAPPGWMILTADYSQIELRLLAHFSEDAGLRAAFAEDRDIHSRVAAEIFKVPEEAVTSDQRRVAKTVNFGVIYGMSAHGLAVRLGLPRRAGEKFIDDYFARYPKVLAYQDNLLANARATGYVGTILGRRRRFDPAALQEGSSYQNRTGAEREAINMEIQGSAADLMKQAMLNVHRRLKNEYWRAKMLLSVHDELVFEVDPEHVRPVADLVRAEMTGAMQLRVPLKVDVAAGKNWLDVEDV